MSLVIVVYLLCIQIAYSQDQAPQTCSTKDMRKVAVNETLIHVGCEDYNCGTFIIPYSQKIWRGIKFGSLAV